MRGVEHSPGHLLWQRQRNYRGYDNGAGSRHNNKSADDRISTPNDSRGAPPKQNDSDQCDKGKYAKCYPRPEGAPGCQVGVDRKSSPSDQHNREHGAAEAEKDELDRHSPTTRKTFGAQTRPLAEQGSCHRASKRLDCGRPKVRSVQMSNKRDVAIELDQRHQIDEPVS